MDRRKLVAATAVLCAAVGAGTVAGLRESGAPAATVSLADPGGTPELPEPSALPTTDPVPTAAPTAVPSPAVPPTPPPAPRAPGTAPATRKPAPPPAPGPTSFAAESQGVKLRVEIDRSATATAQLVTFRVVGDSGTAWLNEGLVVFGDTMSEQLRSPLLSACAGNRLRRTTDQTLRHAYRQPGVREFAVFLHARRSTDCSTAERDIEVVVRGTIRVTAGETPTNGPWPLTVDFANEGPQPSSHPYGVWFQGAATDRDGFIRELSIDWGDGSAPYVVRREMKWCEQVTGPRWPSTDGWANELAEHVYAKPGDYVVTFRAVSVGCDGRDREDVALRTTVTAKDR